MFEYVVTLLTGEQEFYKCHQVWTEGNAVSLLRESNSPNRKYDVLAVYNADAIISIKQVD